MAKSPELATGPSFPKSREGVQQAIYCVRILSNRLLNGPMYNASERRRQTLPV